MADDVKKAVEEEREAIAEMVKHYGEATWRAHDSAGVLMLELLAERIRKRGSAKGAVDRRYTADEVNEASRVAYERSSEQGGSKDAWNKAFWDHLRSLP